MPSHLDEIESEIRNDANEWLSDSDKCWNSAAKATASAILAELDAICSESMNTFAIRRIDALRDRLRGMVNQ